MAGKVRHPIDTVALERYIGKNVREIKVPLDVKQVRQCAIYLTSPRICTTRYEKKKGLDQHHDL